ncbi:hypothetical protein, partial [Streptomyces sp. NPDC127118]|uniref:hypothetical protein n=1 Tax=Streptomyces sp. NPDC127118 TaxID=3345369 RepID=UPI00362A763A
VWPPRPGHHDQRVVPGRGGQADHRQQLTALAGSAQIMQLRATARKHRRAHHRAVKAEAKDSSKARR